MFSNRRTAVQFRKTLIQSDNFGCFALIFNLKSTTKARLSSLLWLDENESKALEIVRFYGSLSRESCAYFSSLRPSFYDRKTNSFHKNVFEGRPFSSEGVFQNSTDVRTGLGSPIYLFKLGWDCPAGACLASISNLCRLKK